MTDKARPSVAALAAAAGTAGYAPSVHNTQPWHWRVEDDRMELRAETARQLRTSDPDGRLMVLSCGAALHHARVALAAEGWQAAVERRPDPARPELLARVRVTGRGGTDPGAMRHLQTIRIRRTDRRPVADAPVEVGVLGAIRAAIEAEQCWLHLMRPAEVVEIAAAADRAQTLEAFDPQWREEIAYWAGGVRAEGLGVPATAIPHEAPQTTVPGRDFGVSGDLPVTAGHDGAARYGILFGPGDTPDAWLRAGEALSAAWLVATEHGVSLVPMSAAVEVDATRVTLRRLLAGLGEPFLVLRIGVPDPDHAGPPATPRLPTVETVEVVGQSATGA
jgi:nitroreductase